MLTDEERETLGAALPRQIKRVQEDVLPRYRALGPAGAFAVMLLQADVDAALKAMMEGDVVEMLRRYQTLKGAD